MRGLGDIDYSDEQYTGEQSTSVFSMDYYRNKAREFQVTLNAVDSTMRALEDTRNEVTLDDDTRAQIDSLLDDAYGKRTTLKLTAEAINAGAAVVNSLGGRFPNLSIPPSLGIAPLLPLAAVAAIATAATLIVWGTTWIRSAATVLRQYNQLNAVQDPAERAALARSLAAADAAQSLADGSLTGNIANIVKWAAIAIGAYMVVQLINKQRG